MAVLTKKILNAMGCGMPNCNHDHSILYLHSSCHVDAGTHIRYEKKSERLYIECAKCGKGVTIIQL
jgi:hypothetical protein